MRLCFWIPIAICFITVQCEDAEEVCLICLLLKTTASRDLTTEATYTTEPAAQAAALQQNEAEPEAKKPSWPIIAAVAAGVALAAGAGIATFMKKRNRKKNQVSPRPSISSESDILPRSLEEALERARRERAESNLSGNPAWFDLEVPVSRPPASTAYVR
ncbi:hypothetical protein CAPTEDRAFT_204508 [Capitella teleta]|uniref:Uncharacterized protein n=1 Tax=Capitella teleta TaxID=283909 RepID=R7TXP1_CAPTE|nr:hypothetical protein CAPTEDRAFT_204508 [Capitella teleta]|eukprot:ELT98352.1 hypothetical protein CAPTEDRAFT_204508 [Capitella teleta]